MGLGLAGSAAVGTAALVTGHQNYRELSRQIDQDLSTLEKSIGQLEVSLSSLAEVVLQNRRGLSYLHTACPIRIFKNIIPKAQ